MGREGEDVASTSAAGGLSLRMPSRLHPASVKGAAWQVRGDWGGWGAQVSHSAKKRALTFPPIKVPRAWRALCCAVSTSHVPGRLLDPGCTAFGLTRADCHTTVHESA